MVKPEDRFDHMPHTQPYPVEDVLFDLLEVRLKAYPPSALAAHRVSFLTEVDLCRV